MTTPYGLCSDLHCHAWSQFSRVNPDGVNSRLREILNELRRCVEHASKSGAERVLIAGDVFHVRGQVKPSVLNPVVSEMLELARVHDITFEVMAGNHDLEGDESEWLGAAIVALQEADAINVHTHPRQLEDEQVVMVPWHATRAGLAQTIEAEAQILRDIGQDPAEWDLILHTGINGVLIGVPDHGWFAGELSEFGFKRVFSGHYHHHKVFEQPVDAERDCHVVSIGSLTHQTWSDVGTDAGWMLVDQDGFEFHGNVQPKFVDFDPLSDDLQQYAGNYVRVRDIELDEAEIKALRTGLEDAGAKGVVVQAIGKNKVVTRTGATSGSVRMEKSVADWIGASEINNKKAVELEALSVLEEAQHAEG